DPPRELVAHVAGASAGQDAITVPGGGGDPRRDRRTPSGPGGWRVAVVEQPVGAVIPAGTVTKQIVSAGSITAGSITHGREDGHRPGVLGRPDRHGHLDGTAEPPGERLCDRLA